ncbi:transposase domain-containing protein [Salmonella enterica]|uniref:transposase domain-containing protein n=1 Tax=Salmonella enterica TaxID=28901 RepID=UPI00398C3366
MCAPSFLVWVQEGGGEAAEIIDGVLSTCKLNNVESEAWLRDVLLKISDWSSTRVHDLLTWNHESLQ